MPQNRLIELLPWKLMSDRCSRAAASPGPRRRVTHLTSTIRHSFSTFCSPMGGVAAQPIAQSTAAQEARQSGRRCRS
jgi:hypothetical protein